MVCEEEMLDVFSLNNMNSYVGFTPEYFRKLPKAFPFCQKKSTFQELLIASVSIVIDSL